MTGMAAAQATAPVDTVINPPPPKFVVTLAGAVDRMHRIYQSVASALSGSVVAGAVGVQVSPMSRYGCQWPR